MTGKEKKRRKLYEGATFLFCERYMWCIGLGASFQQEMLGMKLSDRGFVTVLN
jgi:hypothetical protein